MEHEPLKYIPEPDHAFIAVPLSQVPPEPPVSPPKKRRVSLKILSLGAMAVFFVLLLALHLHVAAPKGFPVDSVILVERGETVQGVADTLKEMDAIKSPFAFKLLMYLFGGAKGLQAGDYYLEKDQNAITLALRLSNARYDLKNIRITIPEGFNHMEIAAAFDREAKFTHFDRAEFIELAAPYEGYLFPDTYLFLPNITSKGVLDAMLLNFEKRIETLRGEIMVFGRPIKDIIKMASIIEEEARTEETRKIIAGILWKRLDEKMPLQVDAAFAFVNGKKDSKYLTTEDLKIDSPYNTYVYRGLTPTPIANPGLDAIRATIHPLKTKYYYYLSDDEGDMHYAVTHDQHVANKDLYLR